jgi:hypothetical protein
LGNRTGTMNGDRFVQSALFNLGFQQPLSWHECLYFTEPSTWTVLLDISAAPHVVNLFSQPTHLLESSFSAFNCHVLQHARSWSTFRDLVVFDCLCPKTRTNFSRGHSCSWGLITGPTQPRESRSFAWKETPLHNHIHFGSPVRTWP